MASAENQQHTFPAAPPPHSAGDHEMRDYYAAQDAPRPTSDQAPYLTPYLGLRARLSQVWINRWTILLLLVLIRTIFAIASLDHELGSARKHALSACRSVEYVGSAMASMPYYMATGVNELSADGIEKAINGLMSMLLLSVTGVEEMIVFIINLLTSTYVCLITFAVGGSLHIAIDVAENVGNFLNATVKDVGNDLGAAASGFETAMNTFLGAVDDIGSVFAGHKLTPPTINLDSSIAKLDHFQLPAGYDQGLSKLNNSIPTFAQVHNLTNFAIMLPFEEVKKLLNQSMGTYTLNRSLFPVPAKEQLTFCSDNKGIEDFFDDLIHIEQFARKIFLIVILTAAVLVCIPMAYREIRRWRFMNDRAQLIRSGAHDPMDSVYLVSRPYTSTAGIKLGEKMSSSRGKALVRWSVAYATTAPALFILSLAIAGLLGCLCQYILLRAIEKEVPALTHEIGAFADTVVASLNNASQQWAIGINDVINATNTKVNHDVFGWVNITTTAVNNTLNVFVDEMMDALNVTFGGTALYEPVLEVLNCLVLLKIQGIEKALTWVSDNAHIDFPTLPNNTFSLGTLDRISDTGNSSILSAGATNNATNEITAAVTFVTDEIAKAIRQEAIISSCVLLIWVIIALVGVIRSCFILFRGGNESVYVPEQPPSPADKTPEKNNLDGCFAPSSKQQLIRVPTYEQATKSGNHEGNRYNGQPYTLSTRPFPTFQFDHVTSPTLSSGFAPNEKVGYVAGQNVEAATRRPTHVRASSHGNLAITSPTDTHSPSNVHKSPYLQDPFADHVR